MASPPCQPQPPSPPPSSSFVIIAHRGDSSAAPENTLQAFDLALAQGFHHFETDTQLSADGVPVVLHDEALGRVNNGSGPAAAATAQQLQQLDAGSWFGPQFAGGVCRIPTLEAVLAQYRGRVHLHLVSRVGGGGLVGLLCVCLQGFVQLGNVTATVRTVLMDGGVCL